MSNFTDFFPAAGGGGGGIPKYQEFTSSGTFTPTQALIDAGGRIAIFVVGAGGGGPGNGGSMTGGTGGEVLMNYITLTNTNSITVTIGAGGASGNGNPGANTTFAASSAGATDVISLGGIGGGISTTGTSGYNTVDRLTSGFGARQLNTLLGSSAGSGTFGYGVGGMTYYMSGIKTPKVNSGSGGGSLNSGGSGFVRVTWFE